jgi:hypothetical protein
LRGDKRLMKLAQQLDVHANRITRWRTHLDRAKDSFETAAERSEKEGRASRTCRAKSFSSVNCFVRVQHRSFPQQLAQAVGQTLQPHTHRSHPFGLTRARQPPWQAAICSIRYKGRRSMNLQIMIQVCNPREAIPPSGSAQPSPSRRPGTRIAAGYAGARQCVPVRRPAAHRS